ncbi:MAG: tripartite tricarboxylate transporter substrate binding protein [Betaproteobacteria bacterium]|nr:tripartite tricarboxylate transporter substrate binding protein [Betaproteobacteria bacterium]
MKILRLTLSAVLLVPLLAFAQAYPSKPIRMVVPYAAGGATDTVARAVGQSLSETLGQPVVIDNRGGAGGRLGSDIVAKAAPDGYTLLLTVGPPHGVYPLFLKPVPFDTIKDFTPIIIIGTAPQSIVVNASLPVHSLKELIDYAKKNPGKLSYATTGVGSSQHIGGVMLNRAAGIDLVHVAYKGGAPALNDVLGGQVGVGIVILSNVLPHVRSGRLRLLGVLEAQRPKASPETPTIAEAGVPGYAVPDTWIGAVGPAKLPAAIVNQVNAAVRKSIALPEVSARLAAAGFEVKGNTPQEFDQQLRRAFETYRKIVTDAGIKPE